MAPRYVRGERKGGGGLTMIEQRWIDVPVVDDE